MITPDQFSLNAEKKLMEAIDADDKIQNLSI